MCIILSIETTKAAYATSLTTKSGLYLLQKGRKHAEEILSTKDLTVWIEKYGHSTTKPASIDNDDNLLLIRLMLMIFMLFN